MVYILSFQIWGKGRDHEAAALGTMSLAGSELTSVGPEVMKI